MQSTNEPGAELAALRAVTLDYLDGMVNANEQQLRRAFHPRCLVVGHYHGNLECETVDQFIAAVQSGATAAVAKSHNGRITMIDRAGDLAFVKLECDFLGDHFTDYLTMISHKDRWSIVHKSYYVHESR